MESESRGGEAKSFDFEAKLALSEARKRRIEIAPDFIVTDKYGKEQRGKINLEDEYWWSGNGEGAEWWRQNKQHFKRSTENTLAPANPFVLEPIDVNGEIFMKKRRERVEALTRIKEEIAKLKEEYDES